MQSVQKKYTDVSERSIAPIIGDSDAGCSYVTALSSRKNSTIPYVTRASLRTRDHDGSGKTEEARSRGDGSLSSRRRLCVLWRFVCIS